MAPLGANSQPWEFVVVKEKELRGRIVDFEMNRMLENILIVSIGSGCFIKFH